MVHTIKIKNSKHFSIQSYCNARTYSLITRKRKHQQASAGCRCVEITFRRLVGDTNPEINNDNDAKL